MTTVNNCSFKRFSKSSLRRLMELIGGDGHSIYDAVGLAEEAGLTPGEAAILGSCGRWHESDGTPKGTIDGDVNMRMFGAYSLDIHRRIASDLGLEYRSAMGRGFEAQNIARAIREYTEETVTP